MKNTRLLLTRSAAFTATLGVAGSFLPQEIIGRFGSAPDWSAVLVLQITGALYLGFAMLDWMARGNLTGGIYGGRSPLATSCTSPW